MLKIVSYFLKGVFDEETPPQWVLSMELSTQKKINIIYNNIYKVVVVDSVRTRTRTRIRASDGDNNSNKKTRFLFFVF